MLLQLMLPLLAVSAVDGIFLDTLSHQTNDVNGMTYRAAVYEHAVILPEPLATSRSEALKQMMVNLRIYEQQAVLAGNAGADILVFPEDGIYGNKHIRDSVRYYLERIPDPKSVSWIPCDDPSRYPDVEVQVFLSCLAKHNALYIVANFGDAQKCLSADPNCPAEGQYQYNTDIVFDKTGQLIARYHKQNLFFEAQFDSPINPEYIYFDTNFGRFGVFTCFDILFHEPVVPLVEQYNITDIAFPTAWMDAFPHFTAIGFHSSFARSHGVNFLAANLHLPSLKFQGSGIYTPEGPKQFYYNKASNAGRLLISDVERVKKSQRHHTRLSQDDLSYQKQPSEFKSVAFFDWYNFVSLTGTTGRLTVCQKGFCCLLDFSRQNTSEFYAFGVFNAYHRKDGSYYLQVCILLKCKTDNTSSCGQEVFDAGTMFNSIHMTGTFVSSYQFPHILTSDAGHYVLPQVGTWTYGEKGLIASRIDKPLVLATIVGRVYI